MARSPLTRERALRAAVRLADEAGLEALSMRRLATTLDVEAMSLYHHVRNKGEILDGMVDLVIGEIASPRPGTGWRAGLEEVARSTRTALARHPWATALLDSRSTPGPARLAHLDAMIGVLRRDGFTVSATGHALALFDSYVRGFALQEQALPVPADGDMADVATGVMAQQESMATSYPHLTEMATELVLRPGYAFGDEFDVGLAVVLDGIAGFAPPN
ncbi:TetR/AcrR family transcriptional regulator [Oerskovia turbata]|uniref:TetR/AcrR family transcriptional regulator n=1 Tax=Oerskovia turbata TaxID=1713 RepID=A0A4Q1KSR1_9CELL|nr:TetR/AcrR family transcriptional regulator [Oerskovia turbata]RXR22364.1 TetR/AcrR family transcriptional regulator [Oerskovia turbata]RXR32429.1 TetR/AcrR family transcriptional regulator [Oerskovia turbata]TGJ95887.1 TetR/AcrR family transcriptional regulator [Actinotalea fermentans ATCC 43279 = JCM 9966 = DSM 3133]